jgi:hypothetical protein
VLALNHLRALFTLAGGTEMAAEHIGAVPSRPHHRFAKTHEPASETMPHWRDPRSHHGDIDLVAAARLEPRVQTTFAIATFMLVYWLMEPLNMASPP